MQYDCRRLKFSSFRSRSCSDTKALKDDNQPRPQSEWSLSRDMRDMIFRVQHNIPMVYRLVRKQHIRYARGSPQTIAGHALSKHFHRIGKAFLHFA